MPHGERRVVAWEVDEGARFTSLADWVSFGDHVVVFDVIGDAETLLHDVPEERPESPIGRSATIQVVDDLYSFPSAESLPDCFEMWTDGSFLRSDGAVLDKVGGGRRLAVGNRYVGSFVLYRQSEGPSVWGLQTVSSAFEVQDQRLLPPRFNVGGSEPDLGGMTLTELESALQDTDVLPGVNTSDDSLGGLDRYYACDC